MKHYLFRPLITILLTLLALFVNEFDGIGSNVMLSFLSNISTQQEIQFSNDTLLVRSNVNLRKEVTYRIQICAVHNKIENIKRFEKACGQTNLIVEKEGEYFKYLTSGFLRYTEALMTEHLIKAIPGFEGSFIIVYKNGVRVKPKVYSKKDNHFKQKEKQLSPGKTIDIKRISYIKNQGLESGKSNGKENIAPPFKSEVVHSSNSNTDNFQESATHISDYNKTKHSEALLTKAQNKVLKINVADNSISGPIMNIKNINLYESVLLFFSVAFLILVLSLIFNYFRLKKRGKNAKEFQILYAEKLAEYWSDKTENTPVPKLFLESDKRFKKDILIKEIITQLNSLVQDSGNKIRDLYFKLGLDQYSIQRLNSKKWNIQAQGIHELAALDIQNEVDTIEDFINHPNPIIKHEAISAMVKLRPTDPLGFLDQLSGDFTKLDQLNTYAIIKKYQITLPDFSRWFDSYNPSTVQFAVDMISLNCQIESTVGFEKLLKHSNEEVRESVVRVIGELHLNSFSGELIAIFNDEPEYLQLLILQTMIKLGDDLLLNFLSNVVLFNKTMKIRLFAAEALINLGDQGLIRIQTLLLNDEKDIRYIYEKICI